MKRSIAIAVLISLIWNTGCMTIAGENLPEISVTPPMAARTVEQTVGNFEFTLEGGKMITSNKAGRMLNDELLKRWKSKGYIEDFEYVPSGEFTGNADYNLILSGSQYGDSSIAAQILSGLTLLIIPHSVDTRYDVQYTLENVETGEKYSAQVADSYKTWIELLLVLALPVATNGRDATMDHMADHLYEQLDTKGAFAVDSAWSR